MLPGRADFEHPIFDIKFYGVEIQNKYKEK